LTGVVTTGSISSTVKLDYNRGTAHKTYEPPAWVRALYRLAFQAPFPYTSNQAALEAARQRRCIVGLLTKFWFGRDLVSPVLDIHEETDGRQGFVTKLVRGTAPRDKKRARKFLKELTSRFLEAGLPTWQVTPYNFRAAGNLIEADDGSYRIIDLESNLVAPLVPLSGIVGAIRQGNFPAFDDIDGARLDAYLAEHAEEIEEALGEEESQALQEAAAAYAEAADQWHRGERRILSRALRFLLKLVDVPTWLRGLRRLTEGGQLKADVFIRKGIDEWAAEGHISDAEAAKLRQALRTPEVADVMMNLGAHMAMSVPLRFPLGSLARAAWTVVLRAKAEWAALRRKRPAGSARQVHTLLVALAGLVPGFGAGAYLLAKPLRSNRSLAVIGSDRLLRKLPLRLYARLHLSALTTWFARPATAKTSERRRPTVSEIISGVRERVGALGSHGRLVGGVLAVNAAVLVAGAVTYVVYDSPAVFVEKGLMNSLNATQLLLAGVFGLLAFATFWRGAARRAPASEAAGIFFWGSSALGLLAFAVDDYFALHEKVGRWIAGNVGMLPLSTNSEKFNSVDDLITLAIAAVGLAVLFLFRHELVARRHSSTLLAAGVVAAALMVATDVYGKGWVQPLEFPAQVSAVGLLLLAYAMRYREVRTEAAAPVVGAVATC
jgi:hypothetical protein